MQCYLGDTGKDLHAAQAASERRDKATRKQKEGSEHELTQWDEDGKLTRLNGYAIGAEVGRGAYGRVVRARKGGKGTAVVAIKILKRTALERIRRGKGTAYDDALREIVIIKRLCHPNVVQLHEVIVDAGRDSDEGDLYLVMELVKGGTLADPIAKARRDTMLLPEATLVAWMRDVVLGLEHLHHSGVCHRDLKPENILWDAKGRRAKLADFGVSAICGGGRAGDYVHGTAGTPSFYAPEMCGDDKTGARGYSGKAADCWALGVCLYMWMYLRPPFEAPTVYLLFAEICEKEPPIDAGAYAASEELMQLLLGLLARQPTKRLRIKDVRCCALLTRCHEMPPSTVMSPGQVATHQCCSSSGSSYTKTSRHAAPFCEFALRTLTKALRTTSSFYLLPYSLHTLRTTHYGAGGRKRAARRHLVGRREVARTVDLRGEPVPGSGDG